MSTSVVLDHHQALSKAKIRLMSKEDSAFFTTVCFSLEHVWDDLIPTACTDGKSIRFNTKFFMGLTTEEQLFLLLHEVMHVAYMHMLRGKDLIWSIFNSAADYVINLQLVELGYTMPKGGLLDYAYKGMSAEEVYAILVKNPDKCPKPSWEDIKPGNGDAAAEESLTREIEDILVRASIQSKISGDKPGSIPGDIEIFLNGLLNPKLPWHRLLQKYLNAFAKHDYSFKKLNRRFFPKHFMPGMFSNNLIDMSIAIDISGSVSDSDFHVFVSEVASILKMMKPEKLTLIQFDTEIHSVDVLRNMRDLMKIKFTGRGGTAIEPVLDWANKNKPQLLMVFTDGEFQFPDTQTKSETLWVIHNDPKFTAPFGKVIHYTI